MFDFSDYPQDSKCFDPVNEKVVGKMKDEFKGKRNSEFVRLKSKMYSLIAAKSIEIKKAKGVNKNVVKNIRHEEYINVLFNKKVMRHNMKRIQSKLHRIGTYNVCKISQRCKKSIIRYQSVVYILRETRQFFLFLLKNK